MEKFISWVEIPASDFERAVTFYNRVFNLDLKVVEGKDEKMAFFPGGEGAISYAADFYPSRDGVLVSLNAGKDLDAVLQRVRENGGEMVKAYHYSASTSTRMDLPCSWTCLWMSYLSILCP